MNLYVYRSWGIPKDEKKRAYEFSFLFFESDHPKDNTVVYWKKVLCISFNPVTGILLLELFIGDEVAYVHTDILQNTPIIDIEEFLFFDERHTVPKF